MSLSSIVSYERCPYQKAVDREIDTDYDVHGFLENDHRQTQIACVESQSGGSGCGLS